MLDLTEIEMAKKGYSWKVERDDSGNVKSVYPVDANGSGIPIQGTAKNHDITSIWGTVSETRQFVAKSDGDPDKKIDVKLSHQNDG